MTYRIETAPSASNFPGRHFERDATIVLVGCGGTGGFLAEALCRLLIGRNAQLYLVDPDRVEPHNVARQAFDRADVGRFKAQVLAERLARRFGREIGYSVLPYDHMVQSAVFGAGHSCRELLVGCVDNAAARRMIAATLGERHWGNGYGPPVPRTWWLDCGNGRDSGQVLLGNASRPEALRGAFDRERALCFAVPAPSLQRPDLFDSPPGPQPTVDCAEAVAEDEQGRTVNQMVAALAATFIDKLLEGTCAWMASLLRPERRHSPLRARRSEIRR
jgi:PRTRC genetic system ThiF family protein